MENIFISESGIKVIVDEDINFIGITDEEKELQDVHLIIESLKEAE
jgi:hypothetical protein